MSTRFLSSRKFWAAMAGVLAAVLIELVPALSELEGSLGEILTVIGMYIIGTGLADMGKSAG